MMEQLPAAGSREGPDAVERVEQLLRDAHLRRMRQEWGAAEALVREALKLDPQDAQGREMLGDLLLEKGELDDAIGSYRAALEIQPGRPTVEEKLAKAVLRKDEAERERIEAELLLQSPRGKTHRRRAANVAILMSLLCPGAGQYFNGQYLKAGLILAGWALCLFVGANDAVKFLISMAGPLERGATPPDGFRATLGFLAGLLWIYSLLDASSQAGKKGKDISV